MLVSPKWSISILLTSGVPSCLTGMRSYPRAGDGAEHAVAMGHGLLGHGPS